MGNILELVFPFARRVARVSSCVLSRLSPLLLFRHDPVLVHGRLPLPLLLAHLRPRGVAVPRLVARRRVHDLLLLLLLFLRRCAAGDTERPRCGPLREGQTQVVLLGLGTVGVVDYEAAHEAHG